MSDVDTLSRLRLTAAQRDGVPWADEIERLPGVSVSDAVLDLLHALPGGFASTSDAALAAALLDAGAERIRHAHQMRLTLQPAVPVERPSSGSDDAYDDPEFVPFTDAAEPPVPWTAVLPSFLAAYPPEHPDHLPGDESLIESYLVPYTRGATLGSLLCGASAIAVRDGHAYGGILVVDRPGEGPWVCDLWRDPAPQFAGAGTGLLLWAAARLQGFASLGLVVTVGNEPALRAYQRAGFAMESTSWTVRLPASS